MWVKVNQASSDQEVKPVSCRIRRHQRFIYVQISCPSFEDLGQYPDNCFQIFLLSEWHFSNRNCSFFVHEVHPAGTGDDDCQETLLRWGQRWHRKLGTSFVLDSLGLSPSTCDPSQHHPTTYTHPVSNSWKCACSNP